MKIVIDTNVLISGVFFGDDKFINCAKDAHALYIVSGDKDLLVLEQYDNIQIITAKEFCVKYL